MWKRSTFASFFLVCFTAAFLLFVLPASLMARDFEIPSTGSPQAVFSAHDGPDELPGEPGTSIKMKTSATGSPSAVFYLGNIHAHRADSSSITRSGWVVFDFYVSDPDALLASVSISGPGFGENHLLKYFPGASAFWEPDYWPSLGQTAEELQSLTNDGFLRFTVSFNPKTGTPWTQEFSYDISKFSDSDISSAFNALSVKRSGSELRSSSRNLALQVLSPKSGDNKFTVQWNGTSAWEPDRARGRISLYEYFSPARRGRYQKTWSFTGNPVIVDIDALETTDGQPIDWREQFVNTGQVDVFYNHPELPNAVLVSRIHLLPDVGLEPEAIISKVFPRKDSASFSAATVTKTARIKASPYKTPNSSWETADIKFFLDGSPLLHRNHESAPQGARYCLAGWTENPSLSGEHELSVQLSYRNGLRRTVNKTINFTPNSVRFPQQTFYILSESNDILPLKPDVPVDQIVVAPHDDYSTEVIVASYGVEGISDNTTYYRSNFSELPRRDPSGGYSGFSLNGMTGISQSHTDWKTTYAAYRYTYSGSVVYDVRYELHSTNSIETVMMPRSSLLYQRSVSAKGEVVYKVGIYEIYFSNISQNLIKSVTITGPGYNDKAFVFWDGGSVLDVVDCPSWEESEFWNTVAPDNTLQYTLTVTRQDGTIRTLPYSIDLSDLRNTISGLKDSFQNISILRQGRELSKGDHARAGEYLHVLSPDNSFNQFTVFSPVDSLPLQRVNFRLSANESFSHGVSQRLEKNFPTDETGTAIVSPSVLYLRGRSGLDPQDWRTWFLKEGFLRTIQDSQRYQSVNDGSAYAPVYLVNRLEILPDVMLNSSVSYRTIFESDSTQKAFTSRKELQFYTACTSLPQGQGQERPVLSGTFAGQTLETAPAFSSGRGSLSNEETNSKMGAFFADQAALNGTREAAVTVTYPSGATRTMRRSFELDQNPLREPVDARLHSSVGGGRSVLVTGPRLWTGAESFRWSWGQPAVDDVSTTYVQVTGLKNSTPRQYGYSSFDGAGYLSAEIENLPSDLDTVHPMLAHVYPGDIGYQVSYRLLPAFSELEVYISGPSQARWNLDGTGSYTSRQAISDVIPGSHTVSFSDIPGWTTPANINLSLEPGGSRRLTGEYTLSASMPEGWKAIEAGGSVRLEWDPVQGFDGPVTYIVNILDENGNVVETYTVTDPFIVLDLEAYTNYSVRIDVAYNGIVYKGGNWNFTPVSSSRGAWILAKNTNIYKYRKTNSGDEWTWTPAQAKYVTAVTEDTCWISEASSNTLYQFSGGTWTWTPAKSKWVSAYTRDDLWLVEANTDTLYNYKDGEWIWTPAKAKVISAPNDRVLWLVEKSSGYVYKHTPGTGTWEWTPGTALSLSAATEDVVWVISLEGNWLYRYDHRTGEWKWHYIKAQAVSAVSESEAWFVDMDGRLCIFKDGAVTVVGGSCADVSAYPSPAIRSAAEAEATSSSDDGYDGKGTGCSASSISPAALLLIIPLLCLISFGKK